MLIKKLQAIILSAFILLIGLSCATTAPPPNLLKTPEAVLQVRELQMRQYDTIKEQEILLASAGVLQDMGFTIDETERPLGIIIASKSRDATQAGQVIGATILTLLGGGDTSSMIDKVQKINVAVITKLSETGDKVVVRVNFQRLVWDAAGKLKKVETLGDPELYQGFFEKLSKAVFLEEHKI